MPLYRATRGVCIGVEKHLKKDEEADLEPSLGQFLVSIGAVSEVKPPPAAPAPEPITQTPSAGKAGGEITDSTPASKKAGKEK